MRRLLLFFLPMCLACSGPSASVGTVTDSKKEPQCKGGSCLPAAALNSHWHPDPDGDGVVSSKDVCPGIYNPEQADKEGDGLCQSAFRKGGPVIDLRAQHVTPYGAWLSFTSPETTRYGKDYMLAWSQDRKDLRSAAALRALPKAQTREVRVFAYAGSPIVQPQIIQSMEPEQDYYISVTALNDNDKPVSKVGRILAIKTAKAPQLMPAGKHPRAFASSSQLSAIRQRHKKGDRSWKKWAGIMGQAALEAAESAEFDDHSKCISAALLFHATGKAKY